MTPDDILGYVVVAAIVIIPGLAISARIALRPIVESIARLRELTASAESDRSRALQAEIEDLRAVTAELKDEVRALREGGEFYRALQAPPGTPGTATSRSEGRGTSV